MKAKEYLISKGLSDSDFQDNGMIDYISIMMEDYLKYIHSLDKDENVELTINSIKKAVCGGFRISENAIKSRIRIRHVVQARQVWQKLASENLYLTTEKVGEYTGGYDHATILHSKKTVQNLYDTNKKYKKIVDNICLKLGVKL